MAASVDELFRDLESKAKTSSSAHGTASAVTVGAENGRPSQVGAASSEPAAHVSHPVTSSPVGDEHDRLSGELGDVLSAFLSAAPSDRVKLARGVRTTADWVERAGDPSPVTEAVERLALEEEGRAGGDCLALALELLTPGVARAMARRVGASYRDEALKARRLRAVGRLGEPMALALGTELAESADRGPRRTYIDALIALGEPALSVVEAMALDTRWFVVRNALRVMREVSGEKAVPHFTAALAHDDARVRREALLSLAHVRGEAAALLVPTKITDPDPEVRQAAAIACGELRVGRAVEPLLDTLEKEEDVEVQTSILLALGQIGDPVAVHPIEKRAETGLLGRKPEAQVRIAAYRALAAIGTPHARKVVEAALLDRDPEVRMTVSRFWSKVEKG